LSVLANGEEKKDEYFVKKMTLVDLAFGDMNKKVISKGEDLNVAEAKSLAQVKNSLICLGNVIDALSSLKNDNIHVPYRASKLTRLLEDSFGSANNCAVILNVSSSPSYKVESLATLQFGARFMKVHINQQ
jgi:hypothetical protein